MPYKTDERLKSYLDTNQMHREQMCLAVMAIDKRFTDVRPRHPRGGPDGARDIEAILNGIQRAFGAVGLTDNILVCLGDAVFSGKFNAPFPRAPAVGVLHYASALRTRQNCGITLSNNLLWNFEDRPESIERQLCGIGLYLLGPKTIDILRLVEPDPIKGERGISEALTVAARSGVEFGQLRFEGDFINMNAPGDLVEAKNLVIADQSPTRI